MSPTFVDWSRGEPVRLVRDTYIAKYQTKGRNDLRAYVLKSIAMSNIIMKSHFSSFKSVQVDEANRKLLTLYQTTFFFTLAQIQSTCRRKINYVFNAGDRIRNDRKHCGKRRKCWLPAFSSFSTMF